MKLLTFSISDMEKATDIAKAADKVAQTPGIKPLNRYVCMGIPFSGLPQNSMCTINVIEADSTEAMAAYAYPIALAGATIWWVPVLEYEVGKAVDTEQKFRS